MMQDSFLKKLFMMQDWQTMAPNEQRGMSSLDEVQVVRIRSS
jgi:hypothetical protein